MAVVVGRVLARSRSRLCCRMCSWITDRDARSRPRTITRSPRLIISECNVVIFSGLLSNARGASWHFGSIPKSEWAFRVAPRLTWSSRCFTDLATRYCNRLRVPFVYRPRARPRQPMLSSPFPFLSTVKSLPEEWFQITTTMSPKAISDIEPIDCHVRRSRKTYCQVSCLNCSILY